MRTGGAIYFRNSNAGINNSTFEANTAVKGAAVYFSCLGNQKWELNVTDSRFVGEPIFYLSHKIAQLNSWIALIMSLGNTAIESGGAIEYDVYRPTFVNNYFENNTAVYGPNIASYPIKINVKGHEIEQIRLEDIGSGIPTDLNLGKQVRVDYFTDWSK
jgi:hypothetical protein